MPWVFIIRCPTLKIHKIHTICMVFVRGSQGFENVPKNVWKNLGGMSKITDCITFWCHHLIPLQVSAFFGNRFPKICVNKIWISIFGMYVPFVLPLLFTFFFSQGSCAREGRKVERVDGRVSLENDYPKWSNRFFKMFFGIPSLHNFEIICTKENFQFEAIENSKWVFGQ